MNVGRFLKSLAKKADDRFRKFHNGKSGMEVLQFAIIVVIAVGLIAVVILITQSVSSKMNKAQESISQQLADAEAKNWGLDPNQ